MENQIEESPLEFAHGLVHDICYNIGQGETEKARVLLKQLDMFLHDEIGKSSQSNLHPIFETIANAIKPK